MDDPNQIAKDIITGSISGAAGKIADSKIALKLFDPAATVVGDLMGQIASVAHFYATDNMARIFKRWADQRKGEPITEAEFRKVMPLLPAASLVSDDDLQGLWARLLESTAVEDTAVLPSFGQTLSQLTAEEARYLERLWNGPRLSTDKLGLLRVYREMLQPDRKPYRDLDWQARLVEEQQFMVIFSDILRLGIIQPEPVQEGDLQKLDGRSIDHFVADAWKMLTLSIYMFTSYGESFMMATSHRNVEPLMDTYRAYTEEETDGDAAQT